MRITSPGVGHEFGRREAVAEIAWLTGETRTEAVRRALAERRERLAFRLDAVDRDARARRFLERDVWPLYVGEGFAATDLRAA